MKLLKFISALAITALLTFLLNQSLPLGGTNLPPLGAFLNPFSGFWQNAEPVKNKKTEELHFSTLSAPVKVVYDERMVPHIFAANIKDANFVQGYITAQNRLWQMDISYRSTSGRLAEIMGENLIKRDKSQRRKGFGFAANNSLKSWKANPETFDLVQAYTDGINAYILQLDPKDYPLEFKLLNYQPELWTAEKSAMFTKAMAADLCFREDDLEATNAIKMLGREAFDFLYPEYNPKQTPIIPENTEWNFEASIKDTIVEEAPASIGEILYRPFEKPDPFLGSNNWAVAGSKTASGNPILCSDPHLRLSLPSIWYEIQIHVPDANAYGVSLPGLPSVIIGFNEHIAWGQTNVGQDVTDWYTITWANDKKEAYLLDGKPIPVNYRYEKIKVKGGGEVIDTVKYTKWGPVVYEDESDYKDMALRWLAHDETNPRELLSFINLAKAKNYDQYSAALVDYVAPPQNFVFASTEGDIAIKVNGRFPIKRHEQGRFVQDGSSSQNAWQGFIPMEQIPQVKNPERGFVSSANQHSTSPDYPYYYNGGFEDYRGRYLNRKLAQMNKISIDDMKALQNDNHSLMAEEALPLLLQLVEGTSLSANESSTLKTLKDWDYKYEHDLAAPVIFSLWNSAFYKATWDEIYTLDKERPMLYPETWRTIALMQEDPNSKYFDDVSTPEAETAKEIAVKAFKVMLEKIRALEEEGKEIRWDTYKGTQINHLASLAGLNSDLISVGGTGSALNAISRRNGPSWRMIVEMGEEVKAYGVYPGGQSGNPGSPFYDDMIQDWTDGKYNELHFASTPEDLSEHEIFTQVFN